MRFIGEYYNPPEKPKFRIIYADSINEATRMAERFCPKGYKLLMVKANP